MELEAINELNECVRLCNRLESLLQQDAEEVAFCVTGEVCKHYRAAANEALESTKRLKYQIQLLCGL